MKIETLREILSKSELSNLPGEKSQFKMVPSIRTKFTWNEINEMDNSLAAVLLLIYPEGDEAKFVLTQRKKYKGTHSNQISLPGGKLEKNETFEQAAIRETFEEIGVNSNVIDVICPLSKLWIAPSKFIVKPFLALTNSKPIFNKDDYEVDEIIEVKLSELFNSNNVDEVAVTTSYLNDMIVPTFNINSKIIWGATAMILSEFKDLILQNSKEVVK